MRIGAPHAVENLRLTFGSTVSLSHQQIQPTAGRKQYFPSGWECENPVFNPQCVASIDVKPADRKG